MWWRADVATGKGAPESFGNIHVEVLSFHAVLKEIQETVLPRPQSDERQARLAIVVNGCKRVLDDLQQLVDNYGSQPTKTKQTWNRMRWGFEDLTDIRGRLVSNTGMLTAFIRYVASFLVVPDHRAEN